MSYSFHSEDEEIYQIKSGPYEMDSRSLHPWALSESWHHQKHLLFPSSVSVSHALIFTFFPPYPSLYRSDLRLQTEETHHSLTAGGGLRGGRLAGGSRWYSALLQDVFQWGHSRESSWTHQGDWRQRQDAQESISEAKWWVHSNLPFFFTESQVCFFYFTE